MADGIVEYIVRLTDRTKAGTASAVKGSKQLEEQTEQTTRAVDRLGDESAQTSRQLDRMGKQGRQASGGLGGLSKGLGGALSSVTSLAGGVGGLVTALGVGALVGTITAATSAVVAFGQEIADLRNDISDASTRSGIAADTLQGLRLAAEGSGLAFSALTPGLDQFGRRLVQAADGGNATAEAFAALGVRVRDDVTGELRDADTVLRETLAALNAMPVSGERSALAMETLGKSGGRLLQALSGSELEDFVALATDFGVDVGPEAAKSAGDWQRASAELSLVLDGLKASLFDVFGGSDLLFAFGEAAIANFRVIGGAVGGFVDGLVSAFNRMIAPLEAVGRALGDLILAFRAVARGDFEAGIDRLSSSMSNLGDAILSGPASAASLFTGGLVEAAIGAGSGALAGAEVARADIARLRERRGRILAGGAQGSQITPTGDDDGDGDGSRTTAPAPAAVDIDTQLARMFGNELLAITNQTIRQVSQTGRAGGVVGADLEAQRANEATLNALVAETRAGRLETAQTAIGVAGQVLGGDLGGGLSSVAGATGLAGLGVAGAAVSGLQFIGEAGADGIRETLDGVKDALLGALEALPELIGQVLPQFAVTLVAELIPALIEAAPELFRAILIDLPVAIARALGSVLRDAFGRDSENRGRNIGAVIGGVGGFLVAGPAGAAVGAGAGAVLGTSITRTFSGDSDRGRSAARTAADGQASGARASDRLAAMSTRPRRRGATVVAQNPYDQLARQYDAQYGTYGRATSTTIRGA